MRKRQAVLQEAAARIPDILKEGSEALRYAYMMLFGYQLTRWAASKLCEDPKVNSPMLQIINDAQMEKSAEPFDFSESMKQFRERHMPWIDGVQREEAARDTTNKKRIKNLSTRIKNRFLPLPVDSMSEIFSEDGGMTHEDTLLIFGQRSAYTPLLRWSAHEYKKAGGTSLTLLGTEMVPTDIKQLPGFTVVNKSWRNKGDTYGMFAEVMKPFKNSKTDPIGLLIVEDLDNLLDESPLIEPRPVRLVRALGLLRQYQSVYPMAMIIGVSTDKDEPVGMRPEEVYPPFLTSHPHLEAEMSDSKLVAGSKNVTVKLDGREKEVFTLSDLWRKAT